MKKELILTAVCLSALVCLPVWSKGTAETSTWQGKTVFEIGTEDKSYEEFKLKGFRDMEVFTWDCSGPCDAEDFPYSLWRNGVTSDRGVNEVVVKFSLEKDCKKAILHLSREGSETTVVTLDGGDGRHITGEQLGSADGNLFGTYDLDLGHLAAGEHTLSLTVKDDGIGIGGYCWDCIRLSVK